MMSQYTAKVMPKTVPPITNTLDTGHDATNPPVSPRNRKRMMLHDQVEQKPRQVNGLPKACRASDPLVLGCLVRPFDCVRPFDQVRPRRRGCVLPGIGGRVKAAVPKPPRAKPLRISGVCSLGASKRPSKCLISSHVSDTTTPNPIQSKSSCFTASTSRVKLGDVRGVEEFVDRVQIVAPVRK